MRQISLADPNAIIQREFDELLDAKRVVIVGGEMPTFNVQSSPSQEIRIERIEVPQIIVQKEVQIIEVEKQVIVKELQIERIEVPVIQTEIKFIEVPVTIIETKIIEIIREVPVIRTEVQVIEKPIIIKETQVQELSKLVKVFLAVNSLATLILLVKLIIK